MNILQQKNIREKIVEPIRLKLEQSDNNVINIKTLHGSLKSIVALSLYSETERPTIVLCETSKQAENYFHDFSGLIGEDKIIYLIKPKRKFKIGSNDDSGAFWLTDGLSRINDEQNPIIISTPEVFDYEVPPPNSLHQNKRTLRRASTVNMEELTTELLLNGFERKDFVSQQGELSLRGGILDIFPIDTLLPYRIEFFGDEIESIRTFDLLSQRSIDSYDEIEFISKFYFTRLILSPHNVKKFLPERSQYPAVAVYFVLFDLLDRNKFCQCTADCDFV